MPSPASFPDEEVVRRVRDGESGLFEILMRRYNRRLYRTVRTIVKEDDEAEDVMQQAYVNAYTHLEQFAGRARFSTWLTRIALHEALLRVRRGARMEPLDAMKDKNDEVPTDGVTTALNPEEETLTGELRVVLESSLDAIPEIYRSVFVLREVEGLDTMETAECLGVSEDTVKTRLHRARNLLRAEVFERAGLTSSEVFRFHLTRCDRVVAQVFARLKFPAPAHPHCDCPGEFCLQQR
ncbi:MAG TPA: RNA polymerase sigma factor [Vicinamibacteria bacterium]|nr:RNA polymerase sigma factor [Vicinamibacteria bacterium]